MAKGTSCHTAAAAFLRQKCQPASSKNAILTFFADLFDHNSWEGDAPRTMQCPDPSSKRRRKQM
jgi:hypothetical protein